MWKNYLNHILFTFCGFLLDCIDYVADAVLGSPRGTYKGRKEAYEVGYLLFSLYDCLLVFADFCSLELKRIAEVVVGFTAYLCAC